MWRSVISLCLAVLTGLSCAGCGLMERTMTPQVANTPDYVRLLRLIPREMQRQGLADENLAYQDAGSPRGKYGEAMYNMVSPDFLFGETGHDIYLGETFHATETPLSHYYPDRDGQGFAIVHASQKLSLRFMARLDWNHDGSWDWLMRCTVETFKGNRVRHYYVLAPEPATAEQMTHGTIMAVVDERGLARPLVQVRDTSAYGKKTEEMPITDVTDGLPGDLRMTEPPSMSGQEQGGVQERNI